MNKFKILLIASAFLSLSSCTKEKKDGFYKGYELPSYQVTERFENIEFRFYEKNLVAEVEVEAERQAAAKEGFMTLARYIFGKNVAQEKVEMTSPVNQQMLAEGEKKSQKIAMTSPVNQVKIEGSKWLVQFGMPKTFSAKTLPKPIDQRIHFREIPERKMVAIIFSGRWSDKKFDENKNKLAKFIEEKGLKTKGGVIISYYDDPFTFPWNRRNEVIWEVR